ncbi:S41 family peptidase [Pedobacter rhodius]|uniref:S41 family peptidase n=1 Tax=Pedobacter rhodius TaxID=3004098 RepID=A0ABT4L000_9SPHI|nr:S41 family peptidase [Pedobacter sp. SJ11]MCZ4224444.1 S41 family peptidase [Pedobacter sp. SJ11]
MLKNYLFALILFTFIIKAKADDCSCAVNFNFMVEKVKKNYVGFYDKVTPANRKKFELFTDSLSSVAKVSDRYRCSFVMREWLAFFKDKHMTAGIDATGFPADSIRKFYVDDKKVSWGETDFNNYLSSNKGKTDSIEGIWGNTAGGYRVGIIRDAKNKNSFLAFTITADNIYWMPQQVKFEVQKKKAAYQTKYFRSKDHSYVYPTLYKNGDTLDFGTYGKWVKNPAEVPAQAINKKTPDLSPKFKVVDEKTALISLPSFASLEYVKVMDTLLKQNEQVLKTTKHLIIDLRNNAGGSVLVYEKLIPYIYTGPILKEGGTVLATKDNIKGGYSNLHPELSDSLQKYFIERLAKLKAHQDHLYTIYPVDTLKLPSVEKYPERISFLVNRNTGSAAELFLLEAKQSTKVKLFGENSGGAIDYTEFIRTKMPCPFFVLYYPACKSLRLPNYPLDNIGIAPDVKIPTGISDWIDYVQKN